MLLNYVPPSYEFSEYHNIVIQASPDHVFTTVKQITLNEVSFFYVLFMKRALPTPILHKVGLPFGANNPSSNKRCGESRTISINPTVLRLQ